MQSAENSITGYLHFDTSLLSNAIITMAQFTLMHGNGCSNVDNKNNSLLRLITRITSSIQAPSYYNMCFPRI